MTTEARNTFVVVGSEPPSNPPEARNTFVVVGSEPPSNPPEIRGVFLVVGTEYTEPSGGGGSVVLMTGRRARRSPTVAV